MTKAEREKRRKIRRITHGIIYVLAAIGAVTVVVLLVMALKSFVHQKKVVTEAPEITEEFLTPNEYSRPQIALNEVTGVVVHYTANPGTGAENNRNYFEGLATSGETYASSHFVIGLEGEVVQCIPLTEISYASNDRNSDTISIECCHPDETGKFNEDTYNTLVHLTAYLMGQYDLEIEDVIRHYDVSGKDCPKYYVENEDAWEQFKSDVEEYIQKNGERVSE